MKLQYFGTAAAEALPAPFCNCRVCEHARALRGRELRTRSQAIIDDALLVDFPADTYDHMLRFGLDLRRVEHLLLTHSHMDHFYAEDAILKRPDVAIGIEGVLNFYGNETCKQKYDRTVEAEHRPMESFTNYQKFHAIHPFEDLTLGKYRIRTLAASHDPREECLLYLISDGEKTIFYGNDSGLFPERTWQELKGTHLDLVSLDCTMLKLGRVPNHMNLEDILYTRDTLLASGAADADTVFVMTHFSHNGGMTHEEIAEFAEQNNFLAAYDGMVVTV